MEGGKKRGSSWIRPESEALARAAEASDPVRALYALIERPESAPDQSGWDHEESFEWLIAVSMCCAALESRLSQARSGSALSTALGLWGAPEALIIKARAAEQKRALAEEIEQLELACLPGRESGARAL